MKIFWKLFISALALAYAIFNMMPLESIPFRSYIADQVTDNGEAFDKLLAEADLRVANYRDDSVPADAKSPTIYAAIKDIAAGKGNNAEPIDLQQKFFPDKKIVREPNIEKKNNMLMQEFLRRSQGKMKRGLDLQGGVAFTLRVNPEAADADKKALARAKTDEEREALKKEAEARAEEKLSQLDQAIEVMSQRVNAFGVSEPVIRPVGSDAIEIQLPGEDTANNPEAINALKKPAKLEFRMVHRYLVPAAGTKEGTIVSLRENPRETASPVAAYEVLYDEYVDKKTGEVSRSPIYVKKAPEATGAIVKHASPASSDGLSLFVNISFTSAGGKIFGDITQRIADIDNATGTDGKFAIVLDGKLMSAPKINTNAGGKKTGIYGGGAQITGNFDRKEATELANALNNPLEFPLELQDMTNVGASLAKDAQNQSINAAIVGIAATVVFMVVFYLWGGLVAVIGIVLNVVLLFGVLCALGSTITLPGIAALVLTIGMAVDSNILVFERIREELRAGKSMATAVQLGYNRAFITILDSQLTTFLVALVLIFLGTGSVRGFGYTLAIGIGTTMFSTLVFCRGLQELLVERGRLSNIFGIKLGGQFNFKFMNYWKASIAIVVLLFVISLTTVGIRGSDCLGKDFKGGESVTLKIVQDEAVQAKVGVGEIQAIAKTIGVPETTAIYQQRIGAEEKTLSVECSLTEDPSQGEFSNIDKVCAALLKAHPELFDGNAKSIDDIVVGKQAVGATVSGQLINTTIVSLIVALFGIAIYVALRFEIGFGIAAFLTTLHDIVIVTGVYLTCGGQLTASMIAALLMVAGYSINDTIVVFDRIREELALRPQLSLGDLINLAINNTLSRTMVTSVTTFLTALALAYFGAGDVAEYGKVFIWGVIIGTFSSVFIASPIFYWWHKGNRTAVEEGEKTYRHQWEAETVEEGGK
ncbi:MAG: protein translocase subunit SecD [Opitutales bacterium]|nr:protein translocase subunit SecD [Opitutales bacterium]